MARLPQPGGDDGSWGSILNSFLSQSHNSDGTLKNDSVTAAQLAPNAVTGTALNVTGGSDGQVLTKDSTKTSGFTWETSAGFVTDASTSVKGVVRLAGDLGGAASAPTVPGLASKVDTSQIGVANGVAALGASGVIPVMQLPSTIGYTLVWNGTAYPARPTGVPAGCVTYKGPSTNAPTDMQTNDDWEYTD